MTNGIATKKIMRVMLGWQVSCGVKRQRLLRSHHEGVNERPQKHDGGQQAIHDADALVVDARDPFAPQVRDVSLRGDPDEQGDDDENDQRSRCEWDRLTKRNSVPG
jgi:hypothetical protein